MLISGKRLLDETRALGDAMNRLSARFSRNEQKMEKIMLDVARLTSEVAEIKSAAQSAKALIESLAQALRDAIANAGNPAELQTAINALADDLDASGTDLAAAVAANTST